MGVREVEISRGKSIRQGPLGDDVLERVATTLSGVYLVLYEVRPAGTRASLAGNVLLLVLEGGLSVSDEWLLRIGRGERLREFRESFFEVVGEALVAIVADITGMPVAFYFYGFDVEARATHAIFVLDSQAPADVTPPISRRS